MKRYIIFLIILTLKTSLAQAQSTGPLYALNQPKNPSTPNVAPHKPKAAESPFYVKIYGFYGLLTPGSQITYSESPSSSSKSGAFKTNKTGLGIGPRAGVGIGLIVSEFINIGLDAEYMFGSTLKTTFTSVGTTYSSTGSTTTTLETASLIPNVTFKALSRPSYYIYNRLGIVVGQVMSYRIVDNSVYAPNAGLKTTYEYVDEYTDNSLVLGYQAALGIQLRLSQHLRGFIEIVAYNQSFKPREVRTQNTKTVGTTVTTNSTTYQYMDQGDYASTSPYRYPSSNVPMNSVGVGAGLLFRF